MSGKRIKAGGICVSCKKEGVLGDGMVITGSKHYVHDGECHDHLIKVEKRKFGLTEKERQAKL